MDHPDIIGHTRQRAELAADLEGGHVAHAYLFAGPPSIGKTMIARRFARSLLLEGIGAEERERTAYEIDRLLHPDLLVLDDLWIEDVREDWDVIARSSNVPQQHRSKAAKIMKTDTISIDDVRVIQERLYETGRGRWCCCIVRSVERMRDEAASAFLKILEEPPEGRVFLLTTESLTSLLPTIVSRTRVVHFDRVPEKEMQPLVAGLPEAEAHFLLHLSQGAPGIARRLREDPEQLRNERLLHSRALSFWTGTALSERLKLLMPLAKRGGEADRLLLHLALTLREHGVQPSSERALADLVRGLETNAHRQLLVQRFALAIHE